MPTGVVPSNTVTVLPGSAVPVRVSVVSLVILSVALAPLSCETDTRVGAAGGNVSTVMTSGVEGWLMLPAPSVAVVVKLCAPSDSVPVVFRVQLP